MSRMQVFTQGHKFSKLLASLTFLTVKLLNINSLKPHLQHCTVVFLFFFAVTVLEFSQKQSYQVTKLRFDVPFFQNS